MISLVRGCDRRLGVYEALDRLYEVADALSKARTILVKPNFVSTVNPHAATHVDAVRGFLDYLYNYVGKRHVVIGEGPAAAPLEEGLENFGYYRLAEEYDVEFVDLNRDDPVWFSVYGPDLERSIKVPVSRTALEADFRVSICRPKTHDTVVVTLTIKNMVMGAVQRPYKARVHQGYGAINLTLALLAEYLMPHLSIIDGLEGMQGLGPVSGTPIRWGTFIAGTNAVEVDAFTAWLMGFNPSDVGYLYLLSKRGYGTVSPDVLVERVVGADPFSARTRFKPHPSYRSQLSWKEELGGEPCST